MHCDEETRQAQKKTRKNKHNRKRGKAQVGRQEGPNGTTEKLS